MQPVNRFGLPRGDWQGMDGLGEQGEGQQQEGDRGWTVSGKEMRA